MSPLYGAKKNVEVLGFVDEDRLKKLYSNATAFVYPSLIEGFGFQGLEAISNGTLLLASDIPVFREVYRDNAIYFNPLDVDSISETLFAAENLDSQERIKRILKGQEFIKKYSWEECAEKTLKVYNQAASRSINYE